MLSTCRGNEAFSSSFPLDAVNSLGVVRATAGPASGGSQAEVGAATVVHRAVVVTWKRQTSVQQPSKGKAHASVFGFQETELLGASGIGNPHGDGFARWAKAVIPELGTVRVYHELLTSHGGSSSSSGNVELEFSSTKSSPSSLSARPRAGPGEVGSQGG